jgi:hypothetical protein
MTKNSILALLNWGAWASGNQFSSLCYPSIEPFRRMYRLPGDADKRTYNETLAIEHDRVMAKLIKQNEFVGVVTALYYMTGMSYCQLAEFISKNNKTVSRIKVSESVAIGEAWFDGSLIQMDENTALLLNTA